MLLSAIFAALTSAQPIGTLSKGVVMLRPLRISSFLLAVISVGLFAQSQNASLDGQVT